MERTESILIDVDGEPVRLCGVPVGAVWTPQAEAAVAEVVRAARAQLAEMGDADRPEGVESAGRRREVQACSPSTGEPGPSPDADATGKITDSTTPRPGESCRWFALCPNDATRYLHHSILGPVPVCDRCHDRAVADG